MNAQPTDLLRPRDVAASLGVSTGRVYQLMAQGVIPHVRVGNAMRIPRQAWERWLAEQNRLAEENTGCGAPAGLGAGRSVGRPRRAAGVSRAPFAR